MKNPLNKIIPIALLLATAPLASQATTFFADYFTNSSTLNSASPANPTPTNTAYELVSSKAWSPAPTLSANDLKFGIAATSSGYIEAQALFAANAVALTQPGDFIQLTVVFTNTTGLLTAAGQLGFGLYNSGQVKPVAGGINNTIGNTYIGNAQNWLGYAADINFTGSASRIQTRPTQSATTGLNQDLVTFGTSSSYAGSAIVGSTTANATLIAGSTYTEVLTITLNDLNSLAITNVLYSGPNSSGTVVTNFGGIATNTTYLTSGFDALAIGYCGRSTAGGAPLIHVASIKVEGSVTTITGPPDITLQPLPVVVPSGGSCDFQVKAQGFNMTYQWHRYGTNLANGGNISGATSDTLILSPVSAADVATGANGYYVTVTGAGPYSTNSTTNSLTLGAASSLVWAGTGNVWDLNTSANWVGGAKFNFGDSVTFDDTGLAQPIVALTGSYLSAATVTVDSTGDYTFSGTGSIAGPGKLMFKGPAHLTMNNANSYSGGTTISNASAFLVLNNYNALGTGPVTLAKAGGQMEIVPAGGATTGINGDVIVNDDFTITYDAVSSFGAVLLGNLSGVSGKTLTITHTAGSTPSRLRIYGTNTVFDSNLNLNGPLILLASYQPSGSQTFNGVISGTGAFMEKGTTTYFNGDNTYSGGTTPAAGVIALGLDSTGPADGVTSGPIGTGPLFLAVDSTTSLTGSGMVLASGGSRTLGNSIQYPSGTNNLSLAVGGNNNLTFTGSFTLQGNDGGGAGTNRTVQVTNTALTTFAGVISDGGLGLGLIKTGNGILALDNTETYTGPTLVSNGTLRVNGQLAAGPVTVATNATLGGTGIIPGPVTVLAGGAIAPGNSIGTLNLGGSLTLAGNLSIEVNRSGLSSDKTIVTGALNNTGTGTVTVTNLGAALIAGDTFTLFNKALSGGATMTVIGAGVNWTNKLHIDGTIAVLSSIPTTPTNITSSVSGNALTLTWPASYIGWSLQSNSVSLTATNWFKVPNSSTNNQLVITLDPVKTNVFYRLVYP